MKDCTDEKFYELFVSRNWAFISPEEQEKIRNTRILLAGCGLGSNIGMLAVETGFLKFVLADGDKVEISNLNRQVFEEADVGKNKALALEEKLKRKSHLVEVEAYPEFITPEVAEKFVSKTDVVVNMVDFNETTYAINDIARKQKKPVFFPMNIGWGHGFCLVFTPKSATLEEVIGSKIINDDIKFFVNLLQNIENYQLPVYILQDFSKIMTEFKEKEYPPQLGLGASCISVTVVDSIVQFLFGKSLKIAPEPMTMNDVLYLDRKEVKSDVKVR